MLQLKVISLILCFCAIAKGTNAADKYTDENRPYEFGFTIEGEQHRHEKKDENGIIMGEFGFITADGVYHVTVYATDENGAFKILSMKNIRVKPYPTAGIKKGHSLPFPPSQNAPVSQGPSSSKSDQESKLEQANKPKASPAKSCSHCKVPTTTTVAPKLTDLAVVSKDRSSIPSSQSVYQQNNPQVISGIHDSFKPQDINQNFPTPGLGQQNNPYYSFDQNNLNRQDSSVQQNNLQQNYMGLQGISGSSYIQNGGIINDSTQSNNAPNLNSQQVNNETPRNYIQENGGMQHKYNGNRDYGNQNYPQGSKLNSPQHAIIGGPKNYQQVNAVNQFYQNENPQRQNNFNQNLQSEQNIKQDFGNPNYPRRQQNFNQNLQPEQNIRQGSGKQNYPQELNNFNQNIQPEVNINEKYPQGLSDTNNNYAQQGKPFSQPQATYTPILSNIPSSNSEIGTIPSHTSQSNLRNPKQYNDIYSTNGGIGEPKGFRDILESQVSRSNQPLTNKPTLLAAQMQIVPKNTDIYYKSPGEKEGLPDGISKNDMTNLLYTFNYTVGFHGHYEEGYTNGAKQGYYFVTGRNGIRTRVDYVADENGFRPRISQEVLELLSDDVPKPETENEERFGLKGYEFKWLYFPAEEARQN